MPIFKFGDKVKIKDDIVPHNFYGRGKLYFGSKMNKLKNKVLTISSVEHLDTIYHVLEDNDNWSFNDEMFDIVEMADNKRYNIAISKKSDENFEKDYVYNIYDITNNYVSLANDNNKCSLIGINSQDMLFIFNATQDELMILIDKGYNFSKYKF